jgi:hypothetical protein
MVRRLAFVLVLVSACHTGASERGAPTPAPAPAARPGVTTEPVKASVPVEVAAGEERSPLGAAESKACTRMCDRVVTPCEAFPTFEDCMDACAVAWGSEEVECMLDAKTCKDALACGDGPGAG